MWNNQIQGLPSWAGSKNQNNLYVSSLTVDTINAKTGNITGISSSVIATGYLILNNTVMTTVDNILYVNGNAINTPSTLSSIADWSYFPAINNVNMNGSTIKNALGISTNYLTANIISNTVLNNNTINNTFFNGRNVTISTLTANVANTSLVNTNSIVASNGNINKLYAGNIETPNISSIKIFTNSISTALLTANTINNILISSSYTSTNSLYAQTAEIPVLKTSSLEFVDSVGRNLLISSILQNRSIYTPDEEDNDGLIVFTNKELDSVYGLITTSENRSTFSIAGATNLGLLAVSTIQMLGFRGIDIKTVRSDDDPTSITVDTDALGITAKAIVAVVPEIILDAGVINTNAYMSTNVIHADLIIANIGDFGVLNTSATLNTNNIINSSNITTATLNVTDNANITNLTANGLTVNDSANYNTYISFGTNNSEFYGAQYLYDINSVRNLQVEKLTVLGGWTGDDILPPYYNDSIVEIGEDSIRPGQVTINGFNPDPLDTGTALTVRGDTQITQNLNVLGLTTLEGVVETIGDLNVDGSLQVQGDVEITGITTATGVFTTLGDANVGGILTVTGETNLLGAVTAEAGIGIVGAMGLTGGDVTFGSSIDTGFNFNIYYTTYFNNGIDLGNNNIEHVGTANFDTINMSSINGNQIVLITNDFVPASVLLYNIDSVLTGAVAVSDSNTVGLVGFDKTKIISGNGTLIESSSNIDISANNTIFTGNVLMNNDLDMGGNNITNVGGLSIATLGVKQSTGGYINAGVVFEQVSGDKVFYQLSKPYVSDPILDPVGSEGIYIVERSTADGSELQHGRIYDDTIYTPWAHVTGDLQMNQYDISNVKAMYYNDTRQPFIQFGQITTDKTPTLVTLAVPYIDTTYTVQCTYAEEPAGGGGGGGTSVYTQNKTTSNFEIHGRHTKLVDWTSFGYN